MRLCRVCAFARFFLCAARYELFFARISIFIPYALRIIAEEIVYGYRFKLHAFVLCVFERHVFEEAS